VKPAPLRAFFFLPNDRVGIWAGDPTRIADSLYWRGDPKPAGRGSGSAGRGSRVEVKRGTSTGRGSRRGDRRRRRVEVKKELPNRRRGTSTGKQNDKSLARLGPDRAGSGRARRVEVKKELPNRRRETSNGDQTDKSLARFADRGARIGADQYRIEGRGAGIADRGTFQPAGKRRGAADYTRKKDTKNPALGGVDWIGSNDQTWKVNDPPSITSRTISRVRSSPESAVCSATASAKL